MNYRTFTSSRFIYATSLELNDHLGLQDPEVNSLCEGVEEEILDKYPSAKSIQRLVSKVKTLPHLGTRLLIHFEVST